MKAIKFLLLLFLISPQLMLSQVPIQEEATIYDDVEVEEVMEQPSSKNSLGYYRDKSGKTGLYVNGERITEPNYDKVRTIPSLGFIVKIGSKFGFLNSKAEELIPVKYDSIFSVRGNLLAVKKNSKYGVFNYSGDKLLSFKFSKIIGGASNNLILVQDKKGELLLLNRKGKPVFDKKLDEVNLYQNGVIVRSEGKHAFAVSDIKTGFEYDSLVLNKFKKGSKKPKYNSSKKPYRFNYQKLNHIIVKKGDKVGLVDTLNTTLIPIENDEIAKNGIKGYYSVLKEKKKGAYLLKCNKYISPEYDNIYMDGTTFLQVTKGRTKGLIDDATGEFVLPIEYESIYKQDTIFVVTKERKKGVFNRKGKLLVPIKYDDIDNLGGFLSHEYDGLLKIKIDSLFGLVNGKNEIILPIEYNWLNDFENKLIIAGKNRKYGLFNGHGKQIQPLIYDDIKRKRATRSKVYFTIKNGLYGILTQEGEVLYDNTLKAINHIHDSSNDLNLISPYSRYFLQVIHKDGRQGVIDGHTGQFLIPLNHYSVLQYLENRLNDHTYFLIKKGDKYGIINENNKILIDFEYNYLDISKTNFYRSTPENTLKNVTIVAKKNNAFGIINLLNEVLVPFKYKDLKKVGSDGLFKAKHNDHFMLIDNTDTVLNKGPFDDISNFEYLGYNESSKALSFYNGQMRELNEKGQFISTALPMEPHQGFTSFLELKLEFINAMESEDDALLLDFVEKISPSKHLIHWLKNSDERISSKVKYLDYERITKKYYAKLLEFKRYSWNSDYFNKNNLYTEDFTVVENLGVTTNKRVSDWAYDDTRILEKFLRNALKINGYWISSYFVSRRF